MTVKHILAEKGGEVFTLAPSAPVMDALKTMADHNVGALVVATPDKVIKGILSERDVVRGLGRTGRDILDKTVADLMTAKVRTCTEEATVPELMELMTKGRFRHLPVERDGKLVGIISIGDVVKRRIEEIEREAEDIRSYITSA